MKEIPVRLGVQQRVLPEYRAPLFDLLAESCPHGLSVFAGTARTQESITAVTQLNKAHYCLANNVHLFTGSAYGLYQQNFMEWLVDWNPGALIVEANPRYLSTPAAARWMHRHGRPVIGWGLGAPVTSAVETAIRRRFLFNLDAVIAYSSQGAQQYIAAGIPSEHVFVAPNAVTPRPKNPPLARPLNYAEGRPTLLYVGRLQARKRLDVLIRACAALPSEIQPRLYLIGDGPEGESLRQLAAQIFPNTIFTGAKHGPELEPFFAAADLFILPGTGGLAVQQAMAHSLPVIVGEADGTQTELVRPENGWMLPAPTLEAMIETLRQAFSEPARLRQMGLASYKIVAEDVNLEKMVSVFVDAVNFALANPLPGS